MVLQAYTENEQTGAGERLYASAAQVRAAASNALHRGADGVCSWFAECVAHSLFSMSCGNGNYFQPGLLVLPGAGGRTARRCVRGSPSSGTRS